MIKCNFIKKKKQKFQLDFIYKKMLVIYFCWDKNDFYNFIYKKNYTNIISFARKAIFIIFN